MKRAEKIMRIIGIETSCDETGIAIYDDEQGLLSHQLYSQVKLHADYGGVVPELASRDHVKKTIPLIKAALAEANLTSKDIDGVAYTAGPGLVGALLVGATIGRSIAYTWGVPAVPVHHMESPSCSYARRPIRHHSICCSAGFWRTYHDGRSEGIGVIRFLVSRLMMLPASVW